MLDPATPEMTTTAKPIDAKDVGLALVGDLVAQNADIRQAQVDREKLLGEGMFQRRTGEQAEELSDEPRFEDVDRAISSRKNEAKGLENANPKKKNAEDKETSLTKIKNAVVEIKNNNVSSETLELVSNRLARIPGVCAALAVELGTTAEAVKLELSGSISTPRLEEIIRSHLQNESFKFRLINNFNSGKLKDEVEGWEDEIASLFEANDTEKKRIEESRAEIKDQKENYDKYTESQRKALEIEKQKFDNIEKTLGSAAVKSGFSQAVDLSDSGQLTAFTSAIDNTLADPNLDSDYRSILNTAKQIIANGLYKIDDSLMNYINAKESHDTWILLDRQEKELRKNENVLRQKEALRRSALENYENGVLACLDKTVGSYWYKIILRDASDNATAKARKKEEDKAGAKERGAKTEEMLDNFMALTFFKWKTGGKEKGKVVDGWDDTWIKDVIHQSVGKGPGGMAEIFIRHLLANRHQLPNDIRQNIDEALGKINKDHPEDPLLVLDSEALRKIGQKFVPLLWGAGKIRGYTLDRLKVTGPQALAMTFEYGNDFWQLVDTKTTELQTKIDEHFGKNTTMASELGNKIRKEFSADNISQHKLEFLMKLISIIGLVGVGALIPGLGALIATGALAPALAGAATGAAVTSTAIAGGAGVAANLKSRA